jgi:hypothetical protein
LQLFISSPAVFFFFQASAAVSAVARLILDLRPSDHIIMALKRLNWLSIELEVTHTQAALSRAHSVAQFGQTPQHFAPVLQQLLLRVTHKYL